MNIYLNSLNCYKINGTMQHIATNTHLHHRIVWYFLCIQHKNKSIRMPSKVNIALVNKVFNGVTSASKVNI